MPSHQEIYILLETKKHDLAIKRIQEKLTQNPLDGELISLLGLCYLQLKQYQKAEETLQKAMGLIPNNPLPMNYLAGLYIDLKKFKKAETLLLQSQRINPNQVFVYILFAKKRLEELDYDLCIGNAKKALSIDPENIRAKSFLALGYHYKRQNLEASEVVNDILRLDPENSVALSIKSFIESSKNNPDQSLNLSTEALKRDPNNPFFQAAFTRALMAQSPLYRIHEAYLKFLKQSSSSINVVIRIAQILFFLFALSVFLLSGNFRTDVLIISLIWEKVLLSLPNNLLLISRIGMLFNPIGKNLVEIRPMFLSIVSILFTGLGLFLFTFAAINYSTSWEIIHLFALSLFIIYSSIYIYGLAKIKGVLKNLLYISFISIPLILSFLYHFHPDQQLIIGGIISGFVLIMEKIKKLIHRL